MELSDFYKQVVRLGSLHDPRGKKEKITSYGDTAILYGDPDVKVEKLLVGIDMETGELLLADRIRQRQGLDLVLAHHPEGQAYISLHEVMRLQVDILKKAGLSEKVARKFVDERRLEVERTVLPQNHMRPPDAARLLNMPFMCAHTPADNHVYSYLDNLFNKEKPKKVQDVLDILMGIQEYRDADKFLAGPRLILGNPGRPAGKVILEMTGGTEGSRKLPGELYKSGVRTIVSMHVSEAYFKKIKDVSLNVVIAGHISSDSLGLNLLLDGIERETGESLQVLGCSGFKRIKRP